MAAEGRKRVRNVRLEWGDLPFFFARSVFSFTALSVGLCHVAGAGDEA
jgi:hypothetical protein